MTYCCPSAQLPSFVGFSAVFGDYNSRIGDMAGGCRPRLYDVL